MGTIKNIVKEEVRKFLMEDPGSQAIFGLKPPMHINTGIGKRHFADEKNSYAVEYFDNLQGSKMLGSWTSPEMAKQNGLDFYNREKKANHLGRAVSYIGMSSEDGDEFVIFYVDKDYLEGVNKNIFKNELAYKNWMKAALEVMKTGEPKVGQYSMKEAIPAGMDLPSPYVATQGATSPMDVVRTKSNFVDRNFVPTIKVKKSGDYYVFHGETHNVRDIFDSMKHHVLIPFQLKVVNDAEYWVTKSKETAQKAIEMINKRYNKDVV